MAIQDDFSVYPDSKVIRYVGNNDNVYTVQAFYSYLQNLFDEPGYMSYEKPIKYNTPTSYTMLNGWFLDNGDADTTLGDYGNILEHLYEGSIDTSGYATVSDPIYMMDVDTVVAAFADGDKDKDVRTNDTDTVGPLLAFKIDYPTSGSARCWFRDVNSIGAPGAGEDVDVPTGTGDYTNTGGGAAASGDEVYANIYNIASWAGTPNAQVYIKQEHPVTTGTYIRVAEWSNADNWDRGTTVTEAIDILLPVKLGGVAIDTGSIVIFGRQTGDTFTHYSTSVSTTGASRTPIAMETSADTVNVTKGEHYLLYDNSNTGSFSEGDVIQSNSTAATDPPTWYAEVVAVTEFTSTTEGILTLRGLRGTIADTNPIYVGTTQEALANGAPGDTYTTYTAEGGTPPTAGDTLMEGLTSTARRLLKGVQDDGTTGALVMAVDESVTGSSKDVYYKDFTTGENIAEQATPANYYTNTTASSTTIVSGYSDVTIAHVNGTVVASSIGALEVGEVVTWSGGGPAIYVGDNGSNEVWLANVEDETNLNIDTTLITGASSGLTFTISGTAGMTDDDEQQFNFPLQSFTALYSVVIEAGTVYNAGRTLEDVYAYLQYKCRDGETNVFYTSDGSTITQEQGQFYLTANSGYAVSKVAPFGTLAGGVFFGAQAVWIQGMDSSDTNSIKLTDQAAVTIRQPYTSVDVTVSNTRVGDRIAVFLEDGTTELPKKDQYTIAVAGVAQSASTINKTTGTDFPNDTPSSGWVYVVDNAAVEEHKYRYTSWSGEALTLAAEIGPTAATGGDSNTLTDTVGTPFATGVEIGDIVRNVTDGGWCYVTAVTDSNNLEVTINSQGNPWAAAKTYEINSTVEAYTNSDTFFIPYLEAIENIGTDGTPGSETNTLTYVESREVVIRVRNVVGGATPIQPFVTTNQIGSTGMSQSVIRTEDEVYT